MLCTVCDLLLASMSTSQSYTLVSVVCGHHVYMSCWTPAIGQILEVHQEYLGEGVGLCDVCV